jgi:hypothetical protein
VLAAIAAGSRTATAYPRFLAAHGYDWFASSNQAVPQVAKLPEVSHLVEAPIPLNGQPTCACTHPINAIALSTYQLSPRALARTVNLVAGRMPDQSDPDQVLVSFNLAQATGVHIGTVIHMPFFATSQAAAVFNAPGLGPTPTGPTVTFRVVGIEAAEVDFASGSSTLAYSMYTTEAFARSVPRRTSCHFVMGQPTARASRATSRPSASTATKARTSPPSWNPAPSTPKPSGGGRWPCSPPSPAWPSSPRP